MKTLAKILSLSILVLFASCKKDDPNFNQDDAVGTWNLTAVSCTDGSVSVSGSGIPPINSTFTVSGKNYNSVVVFNADGTYESQGSYTAVIKINYQGTIQESEEDTGAFEGSGTWNISGNTFTTTTAGETSTGTIEELTSSKMVVAMSINETETDSGFTTTTKGTYRFTLTK